MFIIKVCVYTYACVVALTMSRIKDNVTPWRFFFLIKGNIIQVNYINYVNISDHCSGGRVCKGTGENIVKLIYRRKGQISDPFLFVVTCCYNPSDNLRLCHSNLLESRDTKNLRGCSLVRRQIVGWVGQAGEEVGGWARRCSGLAAGSPQHSLDWQRGGELFLTPVVAGSETLFKTYHSDEVL